MTDDPPRKPRDPAPSDPTTVDSQIIDAINQCQAATMGAEAVVTSGAGKAYQLVAQACALAIQDAVDGLRNTSTIANAAAGSAMAHYIATGEPRYLDVLKATQDLMQSAIADFKAVGEAAAATLANFPSR
jgi:hypothetical protein